MIKVIKKGIDAAAAADMDAKVKNIVEGILADIESRGDAAVRELSEKFDTWTPDQFRLTQEQIDAAITRLPEQTLDDIRFAQTQIRKFAEIQKAALRDVEEETMPGVFLGHKNIPVNSVGCYIPGGKYPMVASAHMSVLTAKVAGVKRVIACAPPHDGAPNDAIVAAMHLAGADEIYCLGGVQAVGAMALGTETMAPVDMIVGPGNAYVAAAKRRVFGTVGIDMIAGPSEVLIVADGENNPDWIAADLLAQAEHDTAAQSILITDSGDLALQVEKAVEAQLKMLPREEVARASWEDFGALIVVEDLDAAMPLANRIAPEHLELAVAEPEDLLKKVRNAGAVFLGHYTPEAIGDYVGGSNHVLPTARSARFSSGLSVLEFVKRTSILKCNADSLRALGPAAMTLGESEGLSAHARSVSIRLNM